MGSAAVGALALAREQAKEEALMKALGQALQASKTQPWINPDVGAPMIPQEKAPGDMGESPPAMVPTGPAGGTEGMIASLLGSGIPEANPIALQMQLSEVERRQKLADALMGKRAEKELELEYGGRIERSKDKPIERLVAEAGAGREPISEAARRAAAVREPIEEAGKRAGAIEAAKAPYKQPPDQEMWMLPGGERVRSTDNGRSYVGADGKPVLMPPDAEKVGPQTAAQIAEARRIEKVQKEAAQRRAGDKDETGIGPSIDYTKGAGPSGFWSDIINTASGAVGGRSIAPEAQEAGIALADIASRTKVALAEEISGRPSNIVINEIDRLVAHPNRLLQGDEETSKLLTRMRGRIGSEMKRINTELSERPELFSKSDVSKMLTKHSQLESLSKEYDAIIQPFEKQYGKKKAQRNETAEKAPEGVDQNIWKYMTLEERALWQK